MNDGYEISENDIQLMVNALKSFDPDNANPETAYIFLDYLKSTVRQSISTLEPNELKNLYSELMGDESEAQ